MEAKIGNGDGIEVRVRSLDGIEVKAGSRGH